jgi:hypothetical protein
MFQFFSVKCIQWDLVLKSKTIIVDFEKPIHTAIQNIFPSTVIHECLFHLKYSTIKFFGIQRLLLLRPASRLKRPFHAQKTLSYLLVFKDIRIAKFGLQTEE